MTRLSCRLCFKSTGDFFCSCCSSKSTSVQLADFHDMNLELQTIRTSIAERLAACVDQADFMGRLESDVQLSRDRVSILRAEVHERRIRLEKRKAQLQEQQDLLDFRRNRFNPKEENRVALAAYLLNPSKYDSFFSALHPFRKFRSLFNSLHEERRLACIAILSMFRFRFINIQNPKDENGDFTNRSPSTELVGDFDALDGTPDQMHVVLLFVVPVLIGLSRILDIPVPFPVVFGTLVSSPNLHCPHSALETGCPPYPRILHAFRRVLSPICTTQGVAEHPPVVFKNSVDLLNENLRYMALIQHDGAEISPSTDPVAILSRIVITTPLSPVTSPRLSPPAPASPRSARSPLISSRKSVIEQSLAEGGEWTLLDQL